MSFDSELNFVWECRPEQSTAMDIARVLATLLCEHAGIRYEKRLEETSGVIARLDALIGHSKLRAREIPESPDDVEQSAWLARAFDPEHPLTELELDELLEPRRAT